MEGLNVLVFPKRWKIAMLNLVHQLMVNGVTGNHGQIAVKPVVVGSKKSPENATILLPLMEDLNVLVNPRRSKFAVLNLVLLMVSGVIGSHGRLVPKYVTKTCVLARQQEGETAMIQRRLMVEFFVVATLSKPRNAASNLAQVRIRISISYENMIKCMM